MVLLAVLFVVCVVVACGDSNSTPDPSSLYCLLSARSFDLPLSILSESSNQLL